MLTVRPSFYDSFVCRASACAHSCCVGWEIDIDDGTRAFYASLGGELGRELREKIADEPQPHFVLTGDGRCPFLNREGLCRIILAEGEDALCDICALHPRFFNCFPGREECGLGLCCEETVRLLLDTPEPFTLVTEDDGGGEEREPRRERTAALRDDFLRILRRPELPFDEALALLFRRIGRKEPRFDAREWARFFLTLEQMDAHWTALLGALAEGEENSAGPEPDAARCGRILSYLLYRHLIAAESEAELYARLAFCAVSTRLVAALDALRPAERDEHLRLFSAEIEYSDENVERICEKFLQ